MTERISEHRGDQCHMGFVTKITGHSAAPPRWIGCNADVGSESIVERDERGSSTPNLRQRATSKRFSGWLPHGAQFEIEGRIVLANLRPPTMLVSSALQA